MFSIVFLPLSFLVGYYGMNFSVFPDIGLFPEGTDPYGPNPQGGSSPSRSVSPSPFSSISPSHFVFSSSHAGLSYFWTITGPVIAVLVGLLFVMNFGSWVIGVGRRLLHRAERHVRRSLPFSFSSSPMALSDPLCSSFLSFTETSQDHSSRSEDEEKAENGLSVPS